MFKSKKTIFSPNHRIRCDISFKSNYLLYSVKVGEDEIIRPSRLGLSFYGKELIIKKLILKHVSHDRCRETIEMPWGEDRYIDNSYNELGFLFQNLTIRFRVFNDAVAFRYEIPENSEVKRLSIKEELSEFNIDLGGEAWRIPAYQPDRYEYNYEKKSVSELEESSHTPLTIKTPNDYYISIHEAALYNYGSMNVKLNSDKKLSSDITPLSDHSKAHINLPFNTPWRLIMIADSAIDLTTNRVMYALNDPPKGDFSWVKTLKFIGIWWAMYVGEWTWAPGEKHGATTEHAEKYIDDAIKLGVSGLLIEGWNEGCWDGDWLENGASSDFIHGTKDFDLERVASYARDRKIELVGHHETVGFVDNYEKQITAAYNLYAKNNINYIKTGYAGSKMMIHGRKEYHHSQAGVLHYQKTVELAAKKHICLDIHEPIKGTGIERTWPNLLTREGARGQEYEGGSLSPSHVCLLPYTRLLSGGMDYTSGIFDLNNEIKPVLTTIARQLAYFVVIYSGMQMVSDRPYIYLEKYPEPFEFIKKVPTNFEKTLGLAGEIGEFYVVARKDRDSNDWYIGGVTNDSSRYINLDLSFLDDSSYLAEIYMDKDTSNYKTNRHEIEITKKNVSRDSKLKIFMAPGGGFAIRLKAQD